MRKLENSKALPENPRVGSSILSLGTNEKLTHRNNGGLVFCALQNIL